MAYKTLTDCIVSADQSVRWVVGMLLHCLYNIMKTTSQKLVCKHVEL